MVVKPRPVGAQTKSGTVCAIWTSSVAIQAMVVERWQCRATATFLAGVTAKAMTERTGMKRAGLALGAIVLMALPAYAENTRFERSLRALAPSARLEQLCDYTAMTKIRAQGEHRPDRAVGYAISEGKVIGDTLVADGAAFRSRKKWYRLSYSCKTTPDRMKVLSFDYKVGPEIPEDKWSAYGLWK
jgi:hypothetical protein